VVEHLVGAGFDLDTRDERKMTALAIAVQTGSSNVIKVLLKKVARDLPDEDGSHALDYAVVMRDMKPQARLSMDHMRRHGWDLLSVPKDAVCTSTRMSQWGHFIQNT
jgi:ankyrin repeat protein